MTPARRRRILTAHQSTCARLGCEETVSLEIDHIIPLELGGADEDHNLEPLCPPHHKAKTKLDVKMIARARRLRKKADPETRKPSRMKSRPFDKGPKRKIQGRPFGKRK